MKVEELKNLLGKLNPDSLVFVGEDYTGATTEFEVWERVNCSQQGNNPVYLLGGKL